MKGFLRFLVVVSFFISALTQKEEELLKDDRIDLEVTPDPEREEIGSERVKLRQSSDPICIRWTRSTRRCKTIGKRGFRKPQTKAVRVYLKPIY